MKNVRRLSALVLTALFLAAMVTSLFVEAHEADHVCIGEDCAACALIAVCHNTIKTLGSGLAVAICAAAFGWFLLSSDTLLPEQSDSQTPVSLRVKLSN